MKKTRDEISFGTLIHLKPRHWQMK